MLQISEQDCNMSIQDLSIDFSKQNINSDSTFSLVFQLEVGDIDLQTVSQNVMLCFVVTIYIVA